MSGFDFKYRVVNKLWKSKIVKEKLIHNFSETKFNLFSLLL